MKVTYCDICYCPIKLTDKKYVLGVVETIERSPLKIKEFKQSLVYNDEYCGTKLYEICTGCKNVLEHFFHIRKDELEKVKEMLEKFTEKRGKK